MYDHILYDNTLQGIALWGARTHLDGGKDNLVYGQGRPGASDGFGLVALQPAALALAQPPLA